MPLLTGAVKERKIGCDRDLPVCHNCTRTGRQCQGYGLRLLWPDRHDGRRKDSGFVVYEPPENPLEASKSYGVHFLNVNHNDVASALDPTSYNALITKTVAKPTRALNLYPTMIGQDALFMSYCKGSVNPSPSISLPKIQ
jgi:hypothetical protein